MKGRSTESGLEHLVLVTEHDQTVGQEEKMIVHARGLLHRAFSVFLFGPDGQMLLQRRADGKYHSSGLWSNACCGHPRPGEDIRSGAERRLKEELGVVCKLRPVGKFRYRAELDSGLIEHEVDHVFVGQYQGSIHPDPAEVADWRWMALEDIRRKLFESPSEFTAWFPIAIRHFDLLKNDRRNGID